MVKVTNQVAGSLCQRKNGTDASECPVDGQLSFADSCSCRSGYTGRRCEVVRPTTSPTTRAPTFVPTTLPTGGPTTEPTMVPSLSPTDGPSGSPSIVPSESPTHGPSNSPRHVEVSNEDPTTAVAVGNHPDNSESSSGGKSGGGLVTVMAIIAIVVLGLLTMVVAAIIVTRRRRLSSPGASSDWVHNKAYESGDSNQASSGDPNAATATVPGTTPGCAYIANPMYQSVDENKTGAGAGAASPTSGNYTATTTTTTGSGTAPGGAYMANPLYHSVNENQTAERPVITGGAPTATPDQCYVQPVVDDCETYEAMDITLAGPALESLIDDEYDTVGTGVPARYPQDLQHYNGLSAADLGLPPAVAASSDSTGGSPLSAGNRARTESVVMGAFVVPYMTTGPPGHGTNVEAEC